MVHQRELDYCPECESKLEYELTELYCPNCGWVADDEYRMRYEQSHDYAAGQKNL